MWSFRRQKRQIARLPDYQITSVPDSIALAHAEMFLESYSYMILNMSKQGL